MSELVLNTEKYKSIIHSVCVDDREGTRIDTAMELYEDFNPRIVHLWYGDYVFKGENSISVGFEFKTAGDFLSSIDDSTHLHNQVYGMVNFSGYDYCFVIVSGDMIKTTLEREKSINRGVALNQVNGVTSTVLLSCPILYVSNDLQAFDLMMRISGKFLQNPNVKYKYHRKSHNTALNLLSSIYGLDQKADLIVEQLKLHTINDVLNLTMSDLLMIDGIGEITARNILDEIGKKTEYQSKLI